MREETMTVAVWSGPARVLASGMVTTFQGHGVNLMVEDGSETWTLEFRFRSDEASPDLRVDSEIVRGGVRLDLVNFDTTEGKGSAEPVRVGTIGEEVLYVHFRAFKYGRTNDHTLHYTLFGVQKLVVGSTPVVRQDRRG